MGKWSSSSPCQVLPYVVMPSPSPPSPPPPLLCCPKCGFIGELASFIRSFASVSSSVPEALKGPATHEELREIFRPKGKH